MICARASAVDPLPGRTLPSGRRRLPPTAGSRGAPMQCPQCQHDNRDQAKFCNECGAKLEAACPQCGHRNAAGSRFCDECGASLGQASPVPAQALAAPVTPDHYTPPHLAERIIASRGALEGERKQVTVLFADLKGSMELLADR